MPDYNHPGSVSAKSFGIFNQRSIYFAGVPSADHSEKGRLYEPIAVQLLILQVKNCNPISMILSQ